MTYRARSLGSVVDSQHSHIAHSTNHVGQSGDSAKFGVDALQYPLERHYGRQVSTPTVLSMVGYTAMMYDHALTFTDEVRDLAQVVVTPINLSIKVQYVWKAEKTPVTFLFLLNRYVTPIVLAIDLYDKGGISSFTSERFCIVWYYTEAVWYLCSFGITHALVAMRVAAIWGRPRWIVVLLISLWLGYFSITSTILFNAMTSKA
ncbi:hypothetical protein FRC09_014137, partial [Ceratobasidium sp. 395]